MSTTLSYGYIQPVTGDPGSVWFPALNDNIQQLNDHAHDGVDSALIDSSSVQPGTVAIDNANWVADGTGRFKQLAVACPTGYNMDDYLYAARLDSGDIVFVTIVRASASTFNIYSCDSSIDLTVTFR